MRALATTAVDASACSAGGSSPRGREDPDDGPRPINARVEGAAASRLFAPALARRRCIVPLDAWYEWTDEDGARQPWLLRPTTDAPVAVAALWSTWRDPTAQADAPRSPRSR
jgi:putative SOS response-associated peptidase YedK